MNHQLRRTDREMSAADTWHLLETGYVGRLGTAGPDGWPYVVPKMYVAYDGCVYFHSTTARGHTRKDLEANPKVCFEVDQPGPVFPTGTHSQCETSVGFESVILFGTCTLVEEEAERITCLERLMTKYADPSWERPAVWNSLDATAVFKITVERITGKRRPVTVAEQWRHQFPAQ
ncbi:MAG TPA: pyridoxamine 5'-phosphate oxidase family protein [Symbiobacteriaceae bacterium]|nr:pyridoxamine 5'-phosphate oxidase family protein [Symbiobacteriaceae bacterium]